MKTINRSKYFYTVNGKEYADQDRILAYLLIKGIVFSNTGYGYSDIEQKYPSPILYVNCSDLFLWGAADAENLPPDQIGELMEYIIADPRWGPDKWCCKKANMQPQIPMVEFLKKEGAWTEELESLPKNPDNTQEQ